MISINRTGKTYVIALTPENSKEYNLINQLLDLEKKYKRTSEEEHDYWTIKPKKASDVIEYTPEQYKQLMEITHSTEGEQMTLESMGFVPVIDDDELPFK